jgi:hypothetical protein
MKNSEIPNMTITGETTIGDLEINDRDNYTHAVEKKSKIYAFPALRPAHKFMGEALDHVMTRCGVSLHPGHRKAHIDKALEKQGVKVEFRKYPPEEPMYKSGLYVYKHGDLMGFVSSPFIKKSSLYLGLKFFIETTELEVG